MRTHRSLCAGFRSLISFHPVGLCTARYPDQSEKEIGRARLRLKPYQHAEYHLRLALIDQAQPGDRVYLSSKD